MREAVHAESLFTEMRELVATGRRVLEWAEGQRSVKGGHLTLAAMRELRGTFETLAKAAAELKAEQSSAALTDRNAVREELKHKLRALVEQIDQTHAQQSPPTPPAPAAATAPRGGPVH